MNFSSILDISSFFIGMIINLLLITLVSFYFKRKYEHLEKSIDEHSEHIYMLLKKERDMLRKQEMNVEHLKNNDTLMMNHTNKTNQTNQVIQKWNYPSVANTSDNSSSDDETETDNSSDEETKNNSDVDSDIDSDEDDIEEIEEINDTTNVTVEEIIKNNENDETDEKDKMDEIKTLTIQEITSSDDIPLINVQKVDSLPHDYNKLTMKQLKDILSNKGIVIKPHMKKNDLIDLASKNSLEIDAEISSKNASHISLTDCDLGLTNMSDEVTTLD